MQAEVTSRRPRFEFADITRSLVEQLSRQLNDPFAAVLLGPRGIGKQQLIADVLDLLSKSGPRKLLRLRCDAFPRIAAKAYLLDLVSKQMRDACGDVSLEVRSFEQFELVICRLLASQDFQLTIVVSNLDTLPTSLARQLLILFRSLRSRETSFNGQLSILITGSADLVSLVYGADSEFTPDRQLVLSGCDQTNFRETAQRGFQAVLQNLQDDVWHVLHEYTGGSLLMLQILMVALFDLRRRNQSSHNASLQRRELDEVNTQLICGHHTILDAVTPAFTRAENSIESLKLLRELLADGLTRIPEVDLDGEQNRTPPPADIELCGLARRNSKGELTWHSPLMKAAARQYFSHRALGDAFACVDEWSEAISCYKKAETDAEPWIYTAGSRPRLSAAQRAFESHLHQLVGQPECTPERIIQFFADAARFVLGFDAVYCFHRPEDGQLWICDSPHDCTLAPSPEIHLSTLLPLHPIAAAATLPVLERADYPFVWLIGLPRQPDFPERVLVMSSLESKSPLTEVRRQQTKPVATAFCAAITRACQLSSQRIESRQKDDLLDALPAIFKLSSNAADNVRTALRHAGEMLRKKGYRRIMFSLVDEKSRRIRGVEDICDNGLASLAAVTDYPVLAPDDRQPIYRDIQQECVHRNQTLRIPDAATHPCTNKQAAIDGNIKALVLVPVRAGERGRVTGTMHVERQDRQLPSDHQVDTLEYFAAQLGHSLQTAHSIDLLYKAMNDDPDAVLLINNDEQLAYGNDEAQRTFAALPASGWISDSHDISLSEIATEQVLEAVASAKQKKIPVSRFTEAIAGYRRVVTALPLDDWNGNSAGILLRLQNIERTHLLFEAIKRITAATGKDAIIAAIMESLRKLGHQYARLYLLNSETNLLQAVAQFGFPVGSEGERDFNSGSFCLRSKQESPSSWLCFNDGAPLVLELAETTDIEKQYTTARGLKYSRVKDSGCDKDYLRKQLDDKWVEIPLHTPEESEIHGKITTDAPETLTLHEVEHLKILAEACSAAFSSLQKQQRMQSQFDLTRWQDLNRSIQTLYHGIVSGIRGVSTRVSDLQDATQILTPKESLEPLKVDLQSVIDDSKKRYERVEKSIYRSPVQQIDVLRVVMASLAPLGPERLTVSVYDGVSTDSDTSHVLVVDCDEFGLKVAFQELLENSMLAVQASGKQRSAARIALELRRLRDKHTDNSIIQIDYRDNGCGIPQGDLNRIFSQNVTLWHPSVKKGNGMGLHVVQSAVVPYGGRVWAKENADGAWFVIQLPESSRQPATDAVADRCQNKSMELQGKSNG
ncbi:MAG: ATP-binding protein [Planctomycetaceae bacterium]